MPELQPVQPYDRSLQSSHYFGQRSWERCEVYFVAASEIPVFEELDIRPSLKLSNHSPTGFEWGYGGSGPAQLALALLLHATGDAKVALAYHQRFKFAYVGHFPSDSWQLCQATILRWLNRQQVTNPEPMED